jgi:hypothetical protein
MRHFWLTPRPDPNEHDHCLLACCGAIVLCGAVQARKRSRGSKRRSAGGGASRPPRSRPTTARGAFVHPLVLYVFVSVFCVVVVVLLLLLVVVVAVLVAMVRSAGQPRGRMCPRSYKNFTSVVSLARSLVRASMEPTPCRRHSLSVGLDCSDETAGNFPLAL